jgi:hypothetical protein
LCRKFMSESHENDRDKVGRFSVGWSRSPCIIVVDCPAGARNLNSQFF